MIRKNEFPVLEFDDTKEALINPSNFSSNLIFPSCLIITFFKEVIEQLLLDDKIEPFYTVKGENLLILYKYCDTDILIMHGTIGCPACGGFLDELTGIGINKVMFCGGGGVLDKNIVVGKIIVVEGAIRDEGFSYHYLPPSRIVYTNQDVLKMICRLLEQWQIEYIKGLTWTTDAFFRETKALIEYRRQEGALIVEMEQAGCLAVSLFRDIKYGALLYGGDDVSGLVWDDRKWHSRIEIRTALVDICKKIVQKL